MASPDQPRPTVLRAVPGAVRRMYESGDQESHLAAVRVLQRAQQARLGRRPEAVAPRVEVTRDDALPRLAWCCEVEGDTYAFTVGSGVEACDDLVFEGIWDGDFAAGGIDATDMAFGSGARLGEQVVFVPPKHCWEALFVLHDKVRQRTVVSNSMSFAFVRGGLRPGQPFLRTVAAKLRDHTESATSSGLDLYDPLVHENGRVSLHRVMFSNFTVDGAGRFDLRPSLPTAPFADFTGYSGFLQSSLGALFDNARDPRRRAGLEPITPLSSGYDSPAVAVLAREVGAKEAVTIDVVLKGHHDSGLAIGDRLGLRTHVVPHVQGDRLERLAHRFEGPVEDIAEFVATPGMGDDVMLLPLEPHLRDRVLLSGAMGDSGWRRPPRLAPGLPVGTPYHKSFTEFRLRVGYAYVPVPALGARWPWPVRRITYSPEMEPYTLFRPYDRPIARRLIEEAGLPRGTFAVAKSATNPSILNRDELFDDSLALVMERYG